MIRTVLRYVAKIIAGQNWLYKLYSPIAYLNSHVLYVRSSKTRMINAAKNDEELIAVVGDPVVKNGFFQGMKYPSYDSVCSTIFPKIIGSYEAELNEVLQQIIQNNYDVIIDVGCAEGYYAVGLAMKTNAAVFAYDTDENARKLCLEMATLNGVEQKIQIKEAFSIENIKVLDAAKKILIICDCEGYEKTLFTKESIPYLKNTDVLIETHDFLDMTISSTITALMTDSHVVQTIASLDDNLKAKYYQYNEIMQQDIYIKKELLKEVRPCTMEWIWATSKK